MTATEKGKAEPIPTAQWLPGKPCLMGKREGSGVLAKFSILTSKDGCFKRNQ